MWTIYNTIHIYGHVWCVFVCLLFCGWQIMNEPWFKVDMYKNICNMYCVCTYVRHTKIYFSLPNEQWWHNDMPCFILISIIRLWKITIVNTMMMMMMIVYNGCVCTKGTHSYQSEAQEIHNNITYDRLWALIGYQSLHFAILCLHRFFLSHLFLSFSPLSFSSHRSK